MSTTANTSVTVRVPAKVNLQLAVGPREADGFHNLVTVFQAISIYDDVTITKTAPGSGITIAITGDLTYTSPTFNGSANVTAAGTLATVNSNVGSFTNASVTVNAKGLVTAVSNGTSSGTVTSVALSVPTFLTITGSPITTSGTLAVTLSGSALPITSGGTGGTTVATAQAALQVDPLGTAVALAIALG